MRYKSKAAIAIAILGAVAAAASFEIRSLREWREWNRPQDPTRWTAENRAKVVDIARTLESDPLGKKADEQWLWVSRWFIDVFPTIMRQTCDNLLKPLYDRSGGYAGLIYRQMELSALAFVILNPDKAHDDVAVYTAGLEGSLRAYQSILKVKPRAKWTFLDELLEKQSKGALTEYVRQVATKCSDYHDD